MTLHELIELNEVCFGVTCPMIVAKDSDYDNNSFFYLEYSRLGNIFIYTGKSVLMNIELISVDNDIAGDVVYFTDYFNLLNKVRYIEKMWNKSIKLVGINLVELVNFNDGQFVTIKDASDVKVYELDNLRYLSAYTEHTRYYLLEYDQKINMTI